MKHNFVSLAAVVSFASLAVAQTPTERVNVSPTGVQANYPTSTFPMIGVSDDGRIIAFTSGATNLVAVDVNLVPDVFVRDRLLSTTELVSVSSAGAQSNNDSDAATISDDGRYVVFHSVATNLVAGDSNSASDVFLRDRVAGTTMRLSEPSPGVNGNGHSSYPFISGDGRFVSFTSWATNMVAGDTNGHSDVFVRNLATGAIVLASVDSSGVQGTLDSLTSRLSDDGSILVFVSQANNLWPGDTNQSIDVFVRDMATGLIEAASRTPAGFTPAMGTGTHPWISGNGAFVAFESNSPDLGIPPGTGGEILLFDRSTGTVSIVSRNFMGVLSGGPCNLPSLSDDGRYVAFGSGSRKLVNLDFGPFDDIYVVDRTNGEVTRVSMNTNGINAWGQSQHAKISGDGRSVVFCSFAGDLVSGDTNSMADIFVHDRTQTQPVAYCVGKVSGQGCTTSIQSDGMPSISHPSGFLIEGHGIKPGAPGLLFYGAAPNNSPLSGGTLCVQPPAKRIPVLPAGGTTNCSGHLSVDFNAWMAGGHTPTLNAGNVVYAQYWYRDSASSPFFVGFTDALRFVIYP